MEGKIKRIAKLKAGDIVPDNAKFIGAFTDVSHHIVPRDLSDGQAHTFYAPFFFYEVTVDDGSNENRITITESQFDEAWERVVEKTETGCSFAIWDIKKELGF